MSSAGLTTRVLPAGTAAVAEAVRCLADGGLVAFPTETVYGLGADAANGEAVARLYAAKGRPTFNPLIAHVESDEAARRLAHFTPAAERLAAFWPGPLTLVLRKRADIRVADLATAGLDTLALRVPAHPLARELLQAFGSAIVAPSANRSGHVSPTTAGHVLTDLQGRVDLILDGGATQVGLESTIIGCVDQPVLLRSGGLPREAIEQALGTRLRDASADAQLHENAPLAPGMLASHYAPKALLRLEATSVASGEALLAFGPAPVSHPRMAMDLNLSPRGDLIEAAAKLFAHLRALDASGAKVIAVMPIPREGLGEAINDRLARAAAPRC
jgi:L-threonylcarbamoyladenylate synthase